MAARIAGASRIIGVDLVDAKFALARALGCTDMLSATDPGLATAVRDLTDGGVNLAFEASGSRAAMASAVEVTRKGGEIVCVGLGAMEDLYEYSHAGLVSDEKSFRGTFMGSGNAVGASRATCGTTRKPDAHRPVDERNDDLRRPQPESRPARPGPSNARGLTGSMLELADSLRISVPAKRYVSSCRTR